MNGFIRPVRLDDAERVASIYNRYVSTTTVYLTPEACHKGIGPLLMTHLIDECRRQGYHALIACITADNLSSLRFHHRLGFRQVSRFSEVGLKFGRWLDVIDLELIL